MPLGIKKKSTSMLNSGRKSVSNNRANHIKAKRSDYTPSKSPVKNSRVKIHKRAKRGTTDHYLTSDKYFNKDTDEEVKQGLKKKQKVRMNF
jgi:hypothetical protein